MPTYVLSHEAVSDIKGITDYIAQQNVTAVLAENPGLGEVRQGFGIPGCRSFTVSRYVVFLRPSNNGIAVARILDASRDL